MKKIIIVFLISMFGIGCEMSDIPVEIVYADATAGTFYYKISAEFTENERLFIEARMQDWEKCSPIIHFVPNNIADAYFFEKSSLNGPEAGSVRLGYDETIDRIINIDEDHIEARTILHEIGHILGLKHEHQRPDRDQYISINWDNVYHEMADNFSLTDSNEFIFDIEC